MCDEYFTHPSAAHTTAAGIADGYQGFDWLCNLGHGAALEPKSFDRSNPQSMNAIDGAVGG